MAKRAATLLGLGLLLVGLLGFVFPGMLGGRSGGVLHPLVHAGTGAVALAFGVKGSREGARACCFGLGALYGLLGALGFALGSPAGDDARLWRPVPGHLELGTAEHALHVLLGLAFVGAGWATRSVRAPLRDRAPTSSSSRG